MNSARCVLIGWEEGEKSNVAATVHALCMNSSAGTVATSPQMLAKKKKKRKEKHQTQNVGFPPNPNIALVPS